MKKYLTFKFFLFTFNPTLINIFPLTYFMEMDMCPQKFQTLLVLLIVFVAVAPVLLMGSFNSCHFNR